MKEETILDVYWEGPFSWNKRQRHLKTGHVLYALYGAHHAYGPNVLLYIGRTTRGVGKRLDAHASWVGEEYDPMTLRLASIGPITTWSEWDDHERYGPATEKLVAAAEALLIYALQPAYNKSSKETLGAGKGFRIFNTGMIGTMLPEVSHRYHDDGW
ncbi:MAG: hypothetical protein ACRD1X_04855 [Vicinamibacteria bacterium]